VSAAVRRARVADVPVLERIWVDAGSAAWGHILRTETLAAPEALRRAFDEEDALVLVVEESGAVVGFADACPDERGEAVVRAFYTDPPVWGRGVGRVLMDELLAELRARGFRAARLWTAEENHRPRRFYERAGWRLDGTERHESWHGSEFVEVGYRIDLTSLDRA
jgi:GNAT superfamily N-acetyltransferase